MPFLIWNYCLFNMTDEKYKIKDNECTNCGERMNRVQEFCPKCGMENDEYMKPARIEYAMWNYQNILKVGY